VRFILPVTTVGMADMVILITAPIMATHLTFTDPMEITAGEDIMDGAAVITEALVGVVDMAGTEVDMAEADMDGTVEEGMFGAEVDTAEALAVMVTTNINIELTRLIRTQSGGSQSYLTSSF
jgi:hypothetical protein